MLLVEGNLVTRNVYRMNSKVIRVLRTQLEDALANYLPPSESLGFVETGSLIGYRISAFSL